MKPKGWNLCRGEKDNKILHGMCNTKFYYVWRTIKSRCYNINNKRYNRYGGRGIKCMWKDFLEFKNDMYELYLEHEKKYGGRNTSIERKDSNGNYCKENCCWATQKEQQNNRNNNILYEYNSKKYTIRQLSDICGLSYHTIRQRIKRLGMGANEAINR